MRLLLLLILFSVSVHAQEFNFSVKINTQKLQTVDPKVFVTLEQSINEFLNTTRWTESSYQPFERIKGNFLLTIQEELSTTSFKAELAIQATRPVFGAGTYATTLFNHIDKDFTFSYEQFQPIQYSKNSFVDNLSSVLSFYAFVILGLDGDSFALNGGNQAFQNALDIISNAPQGNGTGWGTDGSRNRYWLLENILSPRCRAYREAMYIYHRLALDGMHQDAAKSRVILTEALTNMEKVNMAYPNAMITQIFVNAKALELTEIFKRGTPEEKDIFSRVLMRIDAPNADRYRAIR